MHLNTVFHLFSKGPYKTEFPNILAKACVKRVFMTLSNIYDEYFAKIFNNFQPLTIFAKSSILDV